MNTENVKVQPKSGMENGSQMRITDDERNLIVATFKNNEPLLKLMRKMFLPELDPTAPIGQMIDLWMTVSTKDTTPEDVYVNLLARNTLIAHLDNCLMQLKLIALTEGQTPEEIKANLKSNSNK